MLRYEYKYLVPFSQLEDLREYLSPFVRVDPYSPETEKNLYTVRSIYFDTSDLKYYLEKVEGLIRRKKIRLRGYNELDDASNLFFEIKRKHQSGIHKSRVKLDFETAKKIVSSPNFSPEKFRNRNSSLNGEIDKFYYYIIRERLRPELLVVYEREAYYDKFNFATRMTFDLNLRSAPYQNFENMFCEKHLLHSYSDHFIFEVKIYRGIPLWIKQCIAKFNLTHRALSKYVISWDTQKENSLQARI